MKTAVSAHNNDSLEINSVLLCGGALLGNPSNISIRYISTNLCEHDGGKKPNNGMKRS